VIGAQAIPAEVWVKHKDQGSSRARNWGGKEGIGTR